MKKNFLQVVVAAVVFYLFIVCTLLVFIDRNEKIENGEMIQISEEYMNK